MKKLMIGMALVALAAGCSTDKIHEWMRHDTAEVTDFLPGKERLVRQPDTFPVHYTWMDTNAVLKADFKRVYVAPFDLSYLRKGNGYDEWRNKVAGLDDAITELGEYGRKALVQAFKDRKIPVADDPKAPNTAIFEFAITGFVPTRAEIEVVGFVGGLFCPVPGVGLVADCLASGEMAIECRVRDSATKEVVLMLADAEGALAVREVLLYGGGEDQPEADCEGCGRELRDRGCVADAPRFPAQFHCAPVGVQPE